MTLPHPDMVTSRQRIAEAAQQAWKAYGGAAENPYPEHTEHHVEWELAFRRAQASDELEGSAA